MMIFWLKSAPAFALLLLATNATARGLDWNKDQLSEFTELRADAQLPESRKIPVSPARLDQGAIDEDDDPALGGKEAPVALISFGSYQCPYSKAFYLEILPRLQAEYVDKGKVRFVFRDFPLPKHKNSKPAAEASECADEQGKFWDFHGGLFLNQKRLGPELYVELAQQSGLDLARFKECIDSGKYRQEVEIDHDYGIKIGVTGTPTAFINGKIFAGMEPYEKFKALIDEELARHP